MRILITGAAGYVGTVLCSRLLDDDHEVLGVDSFAFNNETAIAHLLGRRGFGFCLHDARDVSGMRPLVERADVVIPLAALVGAPACDLFPDYAATLNTDAVVDLLAALSPNQRVIFPNTNSGYGRGGDEPVTEESPLEPVSHYGRTKVAAEKAVLDKGGVSLRLATVFGVSPRMRFDLMVNDFTRVLAAGGTLEVYEPQYRRNFVHVRDVAAAFAHAVDRPDMAGAFNVGDPSGNYTKLALAQEIARLLGLPERVVTAGVGLDPDGRDYYVSDAKLYATGFECSHTLADGVMDVAGYAGLLTEPAMKRMRNL